MRRLVYRLIHIVNEFNDLEEMKDITTLVGKMLVFLETPGSRKNSKNTGERKQGSQFSLFSLLSLMYYDALCSF